MRASTAIKKDVLPGKLSTTRHPSPQKLNFDPERLVQELLSLGHKKITLRLAQNLSHEVLLDLQRRPAPQVTPELISELVRFKLEELGVLEAPRATTTAKDSEEEVTSALPSEEETGSLEALSREPLGFRAKKTQLKTLEKFLLGDRPSRPCPPRTELKLSERGRHRLQGRFPGRDPKALHAELEALFQGVAAKAAGAELQFPQGEDPQTMAVEFFNAMCNLEFLPHHPDLLGEVPAPGRSARRTWLDLPHGPGSAEGALARAKAFWEQGWEVCFRLEAIPAEESFTAGSFEKFLGAVEQALLALPGAESFPVVGLQFNLADPQTPDLIATALSGKFYPKFHFVLNCPPLILRLLNTDPETLEDSGRRWRENLEKVLKDTWKKSESSLAFLERHLEPGALAPPRFREALLAGGGPVVGPGEIGQLGSLNLSILAAGDDVDWGKLRRMVRSAVRCLDNLIEVAEYPDAEAAQLARSRRKLGLGVMGFAELLIKLGLPYDSEAAPPLAEKLMRFIRQEAAQASLALAEKRGALADSDPRHLGLRHAGLTAVVPSLGLALLADVTPGLEALDAVTEAQLDWNSRALKLAPHPLLQQISERRGLWSSALEAEILGCGSVRNCETAPKPLRKLFATRHELDLEATLRIQAALQQHSDGTVGKAAVFHPGASWEDFRQALQRCEQMGIWQLELGQNAVLGEGEAEPAETQPAAEPSLEIIPLETAESSVPVPEAAAELTEDSETTESEPEPLPEKIYPDLQPRPRPEVVQAVCRVLPTGYGPISLILGRDELGPYELKAQWGKAGSRESAEAEALSRLTSLLLGTGVEVRLIAEELRGIRAPQIAIDRGTEILSGADAIAQFLDRELNLQAVPELAPEDEVTVVTELSALH